MEQTKEETADSIPEQSIEENVAWEEWSIVDDGDSSKNHKTLQSAKNDDASSEASFSNIDDTSDAEEAHECIEVLLQKNLDESENVIPDDNQGNEESDGVSVITESDAEEPGDAKERKIVVHENQSCAVATRQGDIELNNLRMIFLVVSSLLGLAVLCIAINSWTRKNMNYVDSGTETKCNDVYESIKKSADVNDVAREMKFGMEEPTLKETRMPRAKEYFETIDSSMKDPENEIFERLQIFQRTMCLLLEDIRYPEATREFECGTNSLLPELMNLRTLFRSVINDMNAPERASNERLLQHVEFQIESMSDSLATDFARSLNKLATKNEKKLEKLGVKLAERLCVLRNTLPSDNKHRESLERSNNFIKNCDKIAAKKTDERRRNGLMDSSGSLKREKKNRKQRQAAILNSNDAPRENTKRRNNTESSEAPLEKGDKTWDTKKSYSKNLPNIPDREFDGTCAVLTAPPKPTWKMKRKSFSTMKQKDFDRKKASDKYPDEIRMKDDREASMKIKTKASKEFDKRKNGKPNTRPLNKLANIIEEENSQNIDSDMKNKRIYPPYPTGSRGKKRFEKKDNEFILLNRNEEETIQDNGHWQFDRSRFRDQLRKDESTSNWYFDRVGGRKSSRMHCDDENEDPRCGAPH